MTRRRHSRRHSRALRADGTAFSYCNALTCLAIPNSVTSIGIGAFSNCTALTGIYFKGDAPGLGANVFRSDGSATAYYLPVTNLWGATLGDRPTAEWPSPAVTGVAPSHGSATGLSC